MSINPRSYICNVATATEVDNANTILQRFWEIEEFLLPTSTLSEEERQCEEHFLQNVQVKGDGRIQVRLPFKKSPTMLGDSFTNAKK